MSTSSDVAVAGLAGGNRVEDDGGRIGTRARTNEVDACPRRPDLELLDGGGTKGIGRADERRLAAVLDEPRQLADGRRLARAVDADNHHDVRAMTIGRWDVGGAKNRQDLGLDELAQRRPAAVARPDGGHDALGRRDADVGGDQRLLERVDGLDVDRTAALLGRIRAPDDVFEFLDELLLRPRQGLLDAIEKPHGGYRSASARCLRPIRRSTASAGERRPASTAAISAVIGSSMP